MGNRGTKCCHRLRFTWVPWATSWHPTLRNKMGSDSQWGPSLVKFGDAAWVSRALAAPHMPHSFRAGEILPLRDSSPLSRLCLSLSLSAKQKL